MANFLEFMNTRKFWLNVLFMFILTLLLSWIAFASLSFYTRHGESIKVPDLRGMTLDKVENYLESRNLRYAIVDSSYNKDMEPLAIIDQNPKPNATVKENRRIYLTVNAKNPPLVRIPDILYASLRNAEVQLQSIGLEVGEMKYVPDLAKNAVLDLRVNGVSIKPGTDIAKGTKIDLVLGNGIGNTTVNVPNLVGKTFLEAKLTLRGFNLNLGAVVKQGPISNEETAYVIKQNPDAGNDGTRQITLGEPIDVFIQQAPAQIPNTTAATKPPAADAPQEPTMPLPNEETPTPTDTANMPID